MRRFIFPVAAFLVLQSLVAQETRAPRVRFTSIPEGATVSVDGKIRGVTPLRLWDLESGTHRVRYSIADYEEEDMFFDVQPGVVLTKHVEMKPLSGLLLVTSEPAGCDISLDGYSLGETPRLITTLESRSDYRLLLQKPGYQSRYVDVKFDGRKPVVRHEKLILDSGVLEVTSEPAGAEITVNGINRGKTPLEISGVPKGRATVSLKLPGYFEETRELSMVAGESQHLFIKLQGLPSVLRVSTVPENARIYINEEPQGKAPVVLRQLKPGKYDIRVELEGFAPAVKSVELGNGVDISEEIKLDNIMGRLEIRTIPGDVRVFVDGRFRGTTSKNVDRNGRSDVLAIEDLVSGEHVVTLAADGYAETIKHPVVENKKTSQLNVRLERVLTPNVEIETISGSVYQGRFVSRDGNTIQLETKLGVTTSFSLDQVKRIESLDKSTTVSK